METPTNPQPLESSPEETLKDINRTEWSIFGGLRTFVLQMTHQLLSLVWTVLTVYDVFNRRGNKLILPPSTPPNVDIGEVEDSVQEDDHLVAVPGVVDTGTKQGDASTKSKTPTSTLVALPSTLQTPPSDTTEVSHTLIVGSAQKRPAEVRNNIFKMPVTATSKTPTYPGGIKAYYQAKIESAELTINERTQNLRRLEAQRNALNARGSCSLLDIGNSVSMIVFYFQNR